MMIRITAPHFTCAVVLNWEGVVIEAAPIVRYMRHWSSERVLRYCHRKSWKAEVLKGQPN